MSSPRFVWFLLLDSATGEPYQDTLASRVSVDSSADVIDVVKAVIKKYKEEDPTMLAGIASSKFRVYKNKAAFDKRNADDGKEDPLEEDALVDGLGTSKKEALVIVVPSSRSSSLSTSESSLAKKEPNPKRKERWVELNAILGDNAKKSKTFDSTGYSDVSWKEVETIFNLKKYVQPKQEVDNVQMDILASYLTFTTKSFGLITTGHAAKRLHFIAPILACVCSLFEGDVEIVAEEDLTGTFLRAHVHFEFMLRRGKKAICIVQAKRDDFQQGMAQDLVGCEVAAEIGGLDIVYGIVTNYMQWNFFRSLNDKVEIEECSLNLTPEGPERESLKKIAGKIYAMLSSLNKRKVLKKYHEFILYH